MFIIKLRIEGNKIETYKYSQQKKECSQNYCLTNKDTEVTLHDIDSTYTEKFTLLIFDQCTL